MATLNATRRLIGRTGIGPACAAPIGHRLSTRGSRRASAFLAVGMALVGLTTFGASTADAAVRRAEGGSAQTSVTTFASLRITSTIHADSYAPQSVAVRPMVFDNATQSWAYPTEKGCTLNYGGSSSSCTLTWLAYPRAGHYFTRMQYFWYTRTGWQSRTEDLGWVYYAG